jgi:hypothetical protein
MLLSSWRMSHNASLGPLGSLQFHEILAGETGKIMSSLMSTTSKEISNVSRSDMLRDGRWVARAP